MKRRLVIPAILWCVLSAIASAGGIAIVAGAGSAKIGGAGAVEARARALIEAKINAVQAASVLAVSPVEAEDRRAGIKKSLASHPERFILSYETVRDAQGGQGVYDVVIEARVDLDALAVAVRALPSEKSDGASGSPRVLILVAYDKNGETQRYERMEEELSSRMKMLGMPVADGKIADRIFQSEMFPEMKNRNFDRLAAASESLRIGYVVLGLGDIEEMPDRCPRSLTFFFFELKTRSLLTRFSRDIGDGTACESASANSAESIFEALAGPIKSRKITEGTQPVELRLEFRGFRGYGDMEIARHSLEAIPSMGAVRMESFASGGVVVFGIRYEGRLDDLAAAVRRIGESRFQLKEAPGGGGLSYTVSY